MTNTNRVLSYANAYLKAGFSVFPCLPKSKRPHSVLLKERGYVKSDDPHSGSWKPLQLAHPTQEDLDYWFSPSNPDLNIAIVTGPVSNLTVVDLDPPKEETPAPHLEFIDTIEALPAAPYQKTGRGGYHLLYQYNASLSCSTGKVHPQVDIKSKGGYIIAAPSVHPDTLKTYQFLQKTPWPHAPLSQDDIRAVFPGAKFKRNQGVDLNALFKGVIHGSRNNSAAVVTGCLIHYLGHKMDLETLLQLLRGWNSFNSPPLPDDELERTFNSILKTHYGS